MKKLLLALLSSALLSCAHAEDYQIGIIGPFGGLNNSDNSLVIPANAAQDLLNVDISPNGKSVKKREGYALARTLNITTAPVHGVYSFYDSSGNDVTLAFNDARLSASVAGAAESMLMSSATAAQTWQCVDSQGFAYCAGTSRQWIIKTQGTTWSQLNTFSSTGTMVAVTPERLVMAGFSGSNANRIDFSKANDFTTWTVGSQPTDPITFTITAPGSRITHIVYAHKKIYWFKESSFGYILEGPELADWKIKIVSSDIGTLDNTSTQDTDGNLYFRGQDGHIYVTDGGSVTLLSKDITTTVESAGSRRSNSVTLTSASDFVAGTFSVNSVYADTETVSGNLQTTFPEEFSADRNGSSTKQVWTDQTVASGTVTVSGGQLRLAVNTTLANSYDMVSARTTNPIAPLAWGTSVQIKIDQLPVNATGLSDFTLYFTTWPTTRIGTLSGGENYTWFFNWTSTTSGQANMSGTVGVQNGADAAASLSVSTTVAIPFVFNVWIATTSYTYGVNGTQIKAGTWSDPNGNAAKSSYIYLVYNHTGGTGTCLVDYFHVAPETFTWTSAAQSISASISAWDTFDVTKADSAGSTAFGLRSSAANTYTTTNPGAVPTINTATYWQVHSTYSLTSISTTDPLSLSDFTQNWFEGSASDKSYATFHDDKVMFSVASGAGQSTNNRLLVYDLVTPGWTLYDLPVNGFYHRNQALYFGSSSDGYVYKFGDVDSDNGSAINAYWKSKDFFLDNPFVDKEFVSVSIVGDNVSNSSMTVTCTVDGSSSTSHTASMNPNQKTFFRSNKNLPAGRVGGTFSVQFGNNATDQPFEIMGVQYGYRPKTWRPEP